MPQTQGESAAIARPPSSGQDGEEVEEVEEEADERERLPELVRPSHARSPSGTRQRDRAQDGAGEAYASFGARVVAHRLRGDDSARGTG